MSSVSLFAQPREHLFGKNRVQYEQRNWKMIRSKHYRVYYYPGGNSLAHDAIRVLEDKFDYLLEQTGYFPRSHVDVIIYTSIADKQQSNIGLQTDVKYGGQTELIKSKIEIAFDGDQIQYQKDLIYEVAKLYIRLMSYGDSFRESIQNAHLINLPDWFTVGGARYIAYGETVEMYNLAFQEVQQGRKDPTKYEGERAFILGQSMWSYIAKKYGISNIPNILNMARIFRSEEDAITSSLGISFESLVVGWRAYYKVLAEANNKNSTELVRKNALIKNNRKNLKYTDVRWNREGTKYAFATSDQGFFRVYTYDVNTKKRKLAYMGGTRVLDQQTDPSLPKLSWKSENEIGILYTKKSRPYLVIKKLGSLKMERKKFVTFDKILDFDFSPNGKEFVFTAIKKGITNLYQFHLNRNKAYTLIYDTYDERSPRFADNSHTIYFLSNRLTEKLADTGSEIEGYNDLYRLWSYDIKSKKLNRHTAKGMSMESLSLDGSQVYLTISSMYTSHIYKLEGKELIPYNINNANTKNTSVRKGRVAFISWYKGKEYLFNQDLNISDKTRLTTVSAKPQFEDIQNEEESILNLSIDGLKFDAEVGKQNPYERYNNHQYVKSDKISYPKDYLPMMGIDAVQTSLVIDPLRGGGAWTEGSMSEYFGNHQLNAGIMALSDFKSSSYQAEYRLLKYRNDVSLSYNKKSIFVLSEISAQRYYSNNFQAEVSRPLSNALKIYARGGYFNTTFSNLLLYTFPDNKRNYLNYGVGLTYDNTISYGQNMPQGTRFRINYDINNAQGSNQDNITIEGFNKFEIEFRNYQRIFKQIVFATRFSYGCFGGKSPKTYLLGGMDNWLFNRTNPTEDLNNPLFTNTTFDNSNVLFADYVTGLRGFNYNFSYGRKHLLMNAEVRVPITKLLYSGPVYSTFLRHLQFISFLDWGTTWNDKHPFRKDNEINKRNFKSKSFSGTVNNYQNPFLYSYGLGARSELFGYYLKLDVAWAVQNFVKNKARVHLTMGYDF